MSSQKKSGSALGSTRFPIEWVPGPLTWRGGGVEWSGRNADHSLSATVEFKAGSRLLALLLVLGLVLTDDSRSHTSPWLVRLVSGARGPVHIRTSHDREPEHEQSGPSLRMSGAINLLCLCLHGVNRDDFTFIFEDILICMCVTVVSVATLSTL